MNKKSRGRPRKFNEEEVLEKALLIFWGKGYSATSLDDLSEATGLNRPSLYSAFGDKKSIYITALNKFTIQFLEQLNAELNKGNNLRDDLIRFYNTALHTYKPNNHKYLGCPVLCNAITESYDDDEVRGHVSKALSEIDKVLDKRFIKAIKENELASDKNPKHLGRMSGSILHSLAIRLRAQQSNFSYKSYIENCVDEILNS